MMRKLFFALPIAALSLLSACAGDPSGIGGPSAATPKIPIEEIKKVANDAVDAIKATCHAAPAVETIAGIAATFIGMPWLPSATAIADSFCNAIAKAPKFSRRGRALAPIYVNPWTGKRAVIHYQRI